MTVAAIVGEMSVDVGEVDAREAALRATPQVAALPRPHTSEGRQLRRWLTQLVVAEKLVAREADQLGVTVTEATSYLRGPSVLVAHGELSDQWWQEASR